MKDRLAVVVRARHAMLASVVAVVALVVIGVLCEHRFSQLTAWQ